jgi:hypothetical protein
MQRADRALRAGVRRPGRFALNRTLFQQRQSVSEGKSNRSTREDRKAGLQEQKDALQVPRQSQLQRQVQDFIR